MPKSSKKAHTPRGVSKGDVILGQRIRVLRVGAKISQADLGDACGISFQQIQKYEKGVNRVSHSRLEQIAKTLGCTMGDFSSDLTPSASGNQLIGFINDPFLFRAVKALHRMPHDLQRSFVATLEKAGERYAAA